MFTHTDEEVAQLAVRAYDDHIRQARAAKPRRSRRSKPPQRKAAAKVKG
jgi:hypothetical protein